MVGCQPEGRTDIQAPDPHFVPCEQRLFGRGLERIAPLSLIGGTDTREGHSSMLAMQIIGGVLVLLFLAAAMTGIEGTESR